MALGKWGRKLDKEFNKAYSDEEQEVIEWWEDKETETTYTWKFDTPDGTKREWVLCKKTGIITKCVVGYK